MANSAEHIDKSVLRQDIRHMLDKFEAAAIGGDKLDVSAAECGMYADVIRRIQDVAARALGYE